MKRATYRSSSRRVAKRRLTNQVARFQGRAPTVVNIPRTVRSSATGYVDVAVANYNCDTTGAIAQLNIVPQGPSQSQRVGKRIALKSLQMRGAWFSGSATITADAAYMIIYDRRPVAVLPAITDILTAVSTAAFNNDTNSGRFRILKRVDQDFIGNTSAATTVTDKTHHTADMYLDLKMMPTVFKATGTGAMGDIDEGALYIVTVGNRASGTTAPILSSAFRLRYVDTQG